MIAIACYKPLHAFNSGTLTAKGKINYIIRPYQTDWVTEKDLIKRGGKPHLLPFKIINNQKVFTEYIEIPCGQCIGCKIDYSVQWTKRCMLEAKAHKNNFFLTLTYDNQNIPQHASLKKADLQKFMKDLRRYFEYHYKHTGIRFFASGEYGENTKRPHYHLIIFNLPIQDIEYYRKNNLGDIIFKSKIIGNIWGKGYIEIGELNNQTAGYTARYTLKKQKHKRTDEYYRKNHLEKEFSLMSRMPGIGQKYYEEHKVEIYKNDEIFIKMKDGSAKASKPPKFYDRMLERENEAKHYNLKLKRRQDATDARTLILNNTTLNQSEYLQQTEAAKEEQIKNLNKFKKV